MSKVRLLLSFVVVLVLIAPSAVNAQRWSGIITSPRAVDWSNVGIPGGVPNGTTICSTLGTSGQAPSFVQSVTASQINTAISSAGCSGGTASSPKVVFLNAGTYNLGSSGVLWNGTSYVVLRGAGADQTLLKWTGVFSCNGQGGNVCFKTTDNSWYGGVGGSATFVGAGPWAAGTTSVVLTNTTGLNVGGIFIIDQVDDLTDTYLTSNPGTIYICESGTATRSGQNPGCSEDGTGGGTSGAQRGGSASPRGEQQIVTVVSCSPSCNNAGQTTVTFTPALHMPNWRASQSPGAWWDTAPIFSDGVENLSVDMSSSGAGSSDNNIMISNCSGCWIKGVRSIKPGRSHISLWTSAKIVVRDSYLYQTQNAVSQSYGVETFAVSDMLAENNIYQQVAAPQMYNSDCEGCVAGYNFSINDYYGASTTWLQQSTNFHSSVQYVLLEGNVGSGLYSDRFHGTAHFNTIFRNRYDGQEYNGTTSTNSHTNPVIIYPLGRYHNIIGNVLGTSGYHTNYQAIANNGPSSDQSIYLIGTGAIYEADDSESVTSLMRWGNYDTFNATVRFVSAEVPSGLSNFANTVPSSQTLPASFYLSSKPSWWPSGKAWPPIGPDVTGGNIPNVGGHAYTIPAQDCYLNVMGGPANGTGGALTFNASACYSSTGATLPNPPTSLNAVVQ